MGPPAIELLGCEGEDANPSGDGDAAFDDVAENIRKSFSDLKITTRLNTEDDFAAATEKFFTKDGNAIVAAADTDTAMLSFFESEMKNGLDGPGTGVAQAPAQCARPRFSSLWAEAGFSFA